MTLSDIDNVLAGIDALAARWADQRDERLSRRHLDRADFDDLGDTGFLRLIVPEDHGGLWRSLPETGPIIIDAVGRLAAGDPSVALVASMHPSVLVFWTVNEKAPEPFTERWADQRSGVFSTALAGHFWGTIASEPGSGGDILRTKAVAAPVAGTTDRFQLSGQKHFGSGSQIVSYMITTAVLADAEVPMGFYLDLREQPWDGSAGVTIARPWDGMGMKATQSHAVSLDGAEAVALAWQEAIPVGSVYVAALGLGLFCSVIAAVVDAAMAETDTRLRHRVLRPFEDVAFAQATVDHWMLTQANRGVCHALQTESVEQAALAVTKAKMGMAATAESILANVSRAVGGGAFSASSPFASWYEDVRALGYLRPPWGLAFDQLIAANHPEE